MVVAVSLAAGAGKRRRKTGESVSAPMTVARGCGGYQREGGRVARGGEVTNARWGVRRVRGCKRRIADTVERDTSPAVSLRRDARPKAERSRREDNVGGTNGHARVCRDTTATFWPPPETKWLPRLPAPPRDGDKATMSTCFGFRFVGVLLDRG